MQQPETQTEIALSSVERPQPKHGRQPRTYEITWFDGRCERLEATQVHVPSKTGGYGSGNVIMFYGPMGLPDGSSWAGRLLLSAVMGAEGGIVAVRDVDADIQILHPRQPRSRWRASLGKGRR